MGGLRVRILIVDYARHLIFEVVHSTDGLVAEEWICSDTATLLSQLN